MWYIIGLIILICILSTPIGRFLMLIGVVIGVCHYFMKKNKDGYVNMNDKKDLYNNSFFELTQSKAQVPASYSAEKIQARLSSRKKLLHEPHDTFKKMRVLNKSNEYEYYVYGDSVDVFVKQGKLMEKFTDNSLGMLKHFWTYVNTLDKKS